MDRYKLARVRWHLGQTLLPDHFITEEDSLAAEMRLSEDLGGLPTRGIGALSWNETLLSQGSIHITSMNAVFPGGLLVDVPGNAVLEPFSLMQTGRTSVSVFLHLLSSTTTAEGVPLYADDPRTLSRVMRRLQLSVEPAVDGALATLPIGQFQKSTDGPWLRKVQVVPPLLLVGRNPFLAELCAELGALLERARQQLLTRIGDSYLVSDRLTNARRALLEAYRLEAILDDMKHEVHPHPYQFFDALRRFYYEQCLYLDALPDGELPRYQHDDPGPGFHRWMGLIRNGMRDERTAVTHVPMARRDGQFVLAPLPEQAVRADSERYLLVQRVQPGERIPLDGVKLASPTRLPLVRRLALKGIPFTHVPYPSFPHVFGPEIDFYRLSEGEEWDFAVREDGVAFYAPPALENSQVSLFWRKN